MHVIVAIVNDERRAAVLSDAPPNLLAQRETLAAADVSGSEGFESTQGVMWVTEVTKERYRVLVLLCA